MFLLPYNKIVSRILLSLCLLLLLSLVIPTATRAQNTEPPPGSIAPTFENAVPPVPDAPPPVTAREFGPNRAPSYTLTLLSGIPFIGTETPTLAGLLQALYRIAIILGAVFAVVRITLAGIQYMGSDSFSSKGDAKKAISEVLIGLLILLSTVLILRTLIGDVNLNPFAGMPAMPPPPTIAPTSTTPPIDTTVKNADGCDQFKSDSGRACPTGGYVGTIQGTQVGCKLLADVSGISGTNWKPMTTSQCLAHPGADALIKGNGTVYAYQAVSLSSMRNDLSAAGIMNGSMTNAQAAEKWRELKKINETCGTVSENATAKVTVKTSGGGLNPYYGFMCGS